MRTRTKLALCAGLLAVAVGVGVLSPSKPGVEIKFVRYEENGWPILTLTNRGRYPLRVFSPVIYRSGAPGAGLIGGQYRLVPRATANPTPHYDLAPNEGAQLIARPVSSSSTPLPAAFSSALSVIYAPQPHSEWRFYLANILSKIGIDVSEAADATVGLPPRETNAPAQPVTP